MLAVAALLFVTVAEAVPGNGKGGGQGGGKGGDQPQPELRLKWSVETHAPGTAGAPYSQVRPAIGPDGTIYAVDVNNNLVAVAPDGTVQWRAAEAGSKGVDVGPDGTIYTGNEDWIKAFNPDGTLKWTFTQTPRAFVFIDVAVGPDGNIYAVASSGMGVFSLEDRGLDGPFLRWTNPETYARTIVAYTELAFSQSTAPGCTYQLYFYANAHTRAVCLDDGSSVFTVGEGNTRPKVSQLDNTWHRGDSAYNPDGSLLWRVEFPLFAGFSEPSLAPDGMHYTVVSGNELYAVDPSGVIRWNAALGENVGLPDVDPTGSLVIMPTSTFTGPLALKAVSATNGSALWRMEFPLDPSGLANFISSGITYTPNGDTAYVMTFVNGANKTYLHAVDTGTGLPSASTILRSTDITLDARSKRGTVSVTATVTVTDESGAGVPGAVVQASWTLPDGSVEQQVATTSRKGEAGFSVSGTGGIYRIDVTDISKDGYTFDSQNGQLDASLAAF